MSGPKTSIHGEHMDRVLQIRGSVSELSQAHTDAADEKFITSALHERAKILRGIHETHGSASSLESIDHEAVVASLIKERIRQAERRYEFLLRRSPGAPELRLYPDGSIRPSPSVS